MKGYVERHRICSKSDDMGLFEIWGVPGNNMDLSLYGRSA